ncbi:hypothetical protein TEQG_08426 [Trichophyton equinum CBS 127.97]|uniref:Uncharacterized protein n=1 Tax=Trichophyton equinum (strain ATCC MYA-4606 / CBS 127.97) TaxID=559882 RepID=F2Q5R3_TRIEC|nr:hypothetical protein TEQG_08426 [Trichophyton equinum CBS 127.97]
MNHRLGGWVVVVGYVVVVLAVVVVVVLFVGKLVVVLVVVVAEPLQLAQSVDLTLVPGSYIKGDYGGDRECIRKGCTRVRVLLALLLLLLLLLSSYKRQTAC